MICTAPVHYPSLYPLNGADNVSDCFQMPRTSSICMERLFRDIPDKRGVRKAKPILPQSINHGPWSLTLSKKPIRNLADLKGLKIR